MIRIRGDGLTLRQQVLYKAAIGSLMFAFVGVLAIFWLLAHPKDKFWVREPIRVITKPAYAGHGVRIYYEYCKSDPAMAVVGGYLASKGVIIPIQHLWVSALPPGCHTMSLDLQIPAITPAGNYKLFLTREYRPTIFSQSSYIFASEPFDIFPAEADHPEQPAAPLPSEAAILKEDPPYNPPLRPWWQRVLDRWRGHP